MKKKNLSEHSFAIISAKFRKNFETILTEYSEARGTLIYEKNLKSKISCQTPFKKMNVKQVWGNKNVLAYAENPFLHGLCTRGLIFYVSENTDIN
jgi:hypothetical protein